MEEKTLRERIVELENNVGDLETYCSFISARLDKLEDGDYLEDLEKRIKDVEDGLKLKEINDSAVFDNGFERLERIEDSFGLDIKGKEPKRVSLKLGENSFNAKINTLDE